MESKLDSDVDSVRSIGSVEKVSTEPVELPQMSRLELYRSYFVPQVSAQSVFIEQIDGYGVRTFSQTTSFASR